MMYRFRRRWSGNCTGLDGRDVKIDLLKACVLVPLVLVLLSGPGSNATGPWWLELLCADDQWTLWAVVPFDVDEDCALDGEGTFVLLPTAHNRTGTEARGIIWISGCHCEGGFDFDGISFPRYELGQGDSLQRRMTELQLGIYETSWAGREDLEDQMESVVTVQQAEVLAKDGAESRIYMPIAGPVVLILHQGELLPMDPGP